MSYHRGHNGLHGLDGLDTIVSGVTTASEIATDPYLPETICVAKQLIAIENGKPVVSCARTLGSPRGGIGLRKAVPVLRAYAFAEQHKLVYPALAVAIIGIPFALGMLVGRSSR